MSSPKWITMLGFIGNYWFLIAENNNNISKQRIVKQQYGPSRDTITTLWDDSKATVKMFPGENSYWLMISTHWKELNSIPPQKCALSPDENFNNEEHLWRDNLRISNLMYYTKTWMIMREEPNHELVEQQLIKTKDWPGSEIQYVWSHGKRIQCIASNANEWVIIAETWATPTLHQNVLASRDPTQVDFVSQVTNGMKLISATYHEISKLYVFLWEENKDSTKQDIFLEKNYEDFEKRFAQFNVKIDTIADP